MHKQSAIPKGNQAKVLHHPNSGGEPVINPRIRGLKKGIPSLAVARRQKVAEEYRRNHSPSRTAFERRYDAAKEKVLQGPDAAVLESIDAVKKSLASMLGDMHVQLSMLEHKIVYRADPELEKWDQRGRRS